MLVSPRLNIQTVLVAKTNGKAMHIPISLIDKSTKKTVDTQALIDSAAGGRFIDQNFVQRHKIKTQ